MSDKYTLCFDSDTVKLFMPEEFIRSEINSGRWLDVKLNFAKVQSMLNVFSQLYSNASVSLKLSGYSDPKNFMFNSVGCPDIYINNVQVNIITCMTNGIVNIITEEVDKRPDPRIHRLRQ